ncbi:hypothetical protein [Arthrobacter humicola]
MYVPGQGSYVVDTETHTFLTRVRDGASPAIGGNHETVASVSELQRLGILERVEGPQPATAAKGHYVAEFTDLVARRESKLLRRVISTVGIVLGPILRPFVVLIGASMLLLEFIFWLTMAPVAVVATAWLDTPVILLVVLILAQAVRLLLHESGHYAVAWRSGFQPKVGVGLYFTGPVAYVDLTPLDVADKKTRLSVDLAGLAVDGFFVAMFTAAYWVTQLPVLAAVSVMLSSVSMASMHPTVKSDGYWAMRDLLDGRALSSTWASPRKLFRASRASDSAGRFARYLLAAYIVSLIWSVSVAPRWIAGILASVAESSWDRLLLPALVCFIFLVVAVVAAAKTKSHRTPSMSAVCSG